MKVVFLTGDHPRHAYMARAIFEAGYLEGLVIETREAFVPQAPSDVTAEVRDLFDLHFARRDEAEARHFGKAELPPVVRLEVMPQALNERGTISFINGLQPDLVLSYGVHKLTSDALFAIDCEKQWNIHGGLSPWYRGVTTHFWPSYHLEPQMTGMTVHQLTDDIDGGDVIHQAAAEMVRGDGLHDLACRAVRSLGEEIGELLKHVEAGIMKPPHRQGTTGRIWRSSDWQPAHLKLIYQVYSDRIVDACLDGAFECKAPKLFRQF